MVQRRLRCQTVLLDAGGVIVLPHRDLVRGALGEVGIDIAASAVAAAHYRAVAELDRAVASDSSYLPAFCRALRVPPARLDDAIRAMSYLADRSRSGEILWSEAAPGARDTLSALRRAGIGVLVVTNSDGRAAENLRDAGICQTGAGAGVTIDGVIDSEVIGSTKPDPAIFRVALDRVRVAAGAAVHIGDMLSTDIAGAHAAGIVPIHLHPSRGCRSADHRHIRSLTGIWRHVAPSSAAT